MHKIIQLDKSLFRLINGQWHNSFFDALMPWLRIDKVWIPFYLFLLVFALVNYKKNGWIWIIGIALVPSITDFISSTLIKHNVYRLRPYLDPEITQYVRLMTGSRPANSSFTSSHAANHFGLATFLYLTLRKQFGKPTLLLFVWAFGIAYAQVYVGVHFPIDVICGGLIGFLIGYLCGKMFNNHYSLTTNYV